MESHLFVKLLMFLIDAYLDHNSHLDRPILKNKDGQEVYTRKWGKRSARWRMVPVPVPKKYEYIPGK